MSGDTDLLRKQIYLHRQQDQQLRRLARKNRMTESALIRKALAEYLAAEERRSTPEAENPVLQMIGMFADGSGCEKVSERTDEYLGESIARDKT